jgi:hypothetical protein
MKGSAPFNFAFLREIVRTCPNMDKFIDKAAFEQETKFLRFDDAKTPPQGTENFPLASAKNEFATEFW